MYFESSRVRVLELEGTMSSLSRSATGSADSFVDVFFESSRVRVLELEGMIYSLTYWWRLLLFDVYIS